MALYYQVDRAVLLVILPVTDRATDCISIADITMVSGTSLAVALHPEFQGLHCDRGWMLRHSFRS